MFYKRLEICLFSDYALNGLWPGFMGVSMNITQKGSLSNGVYFWAVVLKCNTWYHCFSNDKLFCEYRKVVFSVRLGSISFSGNDFQLLILWLFLAVFILHYVRKWCDITRWHGLSDAVYASHRTDNELDLKRGLGSFAHLYRCVVERQLGNMGHS